MIATHARRLFLALGLAASTALGSVATPAHAQIPYFQNLLAASQTKYAAIVVDAKTGEILYAKHADSPRYPASITKVMTLYLTFEALSSGKLTLEEKPFSPRECLTSVINILTPEARRKGLELIHAVAGDVPETEHQQQSAAELSTAGE